MTDKQKNPEDSFELGAVTETNHVRLAWSSSGSAEKGDKQDDVDKKFEEAQASTVAVAQKDKVFCVTGQRSSSHSESSDENVRTNSEKELGVGVDDSSQENCSDTDKLFDKKNFDEEYFQQLLKPGVSDEYDAGQSDENDAEKKSSDGSDSRSGDEFKVKHPKTLDTKAKTRSGSRSSNGKNVSVSTYKSPPGGDRSPRDISSPNEVPSAGLLSCFPTLKTGGSKGKAYKVVYHSPISQNSPTKELTR